MTEIGAFFQVPFLSQVASSYQYLREATGKLSVMILPSSFLFLTAIFRNKNMTDLHLPTVGPSRTLKLVPDFATQI